MNNQVRTLIRLAIDEDIASDDITSELTVNPQQFATGYLYSKERCILCGTVLIEIIIEELGWPIEVAYDIDEGTLIPANTTFARLMGPAQFILSAERIILNFLEHLSGVATRAYVLKKAAKDITCLDTRKTTPGWRLLEKYAARVGGCVNHRGNLSEMILIKNNHIDINNGDFDQIFEHVNLEKPMYIPIEVEVRTLDELKTAIKHNVKIVMLDNMDDAQIKSSLNFLKKNAPEVQVEVSGKIDEKRLKTFQELGVKCISTSVMVTKSRWIDMSMKLEPSDYMPDEHEHHE